MQTSEHFVVGAPFLAVFYDACYLMYVYIFMPEDLVRNKPKYLGMDIILLLPHYPA